MRRWSESIVGSKSSLASSAVTGGTTKVGSVPVRWVRISLFPRTDWLRVVRERGEDDRGILGDVDEEGVELRSATGENVKCEAVDPNNPTSKETTNACCVKGDRVIVKDKEFERGSNVRGYECDEDSSTMGKDKFERGNAATKLGHYARGWLVTGSPFKRLRVVVLGSTDGAIVMLYCAGSVSSPQKPVNPPGSGYEYSVVRHGRTLYRNLAFHLCSWAFASFRVM